MIAFLAQYYLELKYLHIGCVIISVSFFSLRALWAFMQSALLQQKWAKILPHIVDSVLLFSAIALALVWTGGASLPEWILAKIIGLFVYVFFGICTFRLAKNPQQRALYLYLALLTVGYIVGVAFSKDALFFIHALRALL